MANKVSVLIDVATDKAQASMKKLTKDMREADTVTGKFKVGAKGAFDAVKANAAEFAVVAAGALATFAVKATQAFQSLALESGKFADATGVSVEEASRLAEVAGDLGIEVGTLQASLQRFNRAAADGQVTIQGFGNAVVRAEDGTVDAYESFINAATAIGQIEDPTQRAQQAQEIFGRSYGEIAELMAMDANELRAALDDVAAGKVITEQELANARAFRDAMDRIRDAIDEVTLAVGGAVANNSELVETFADSLDLIAEYADEAMRLADAFLIVTNPLYSVNRLIGALGDDIDITKMTLEEFRAELESRGFGADQIVELEKAWFAANTAANEATSASGRAAGSFRDAGGAARGAAGDIKRMYEARGLEAQAERAANLRDRLSEVVRELGGIPAEKVVEINTLLNQGNLADAEAAINNLARSRVAQIVVSVGAAMGGAMGKLGTGIAGGVAAGAKMGSSIFAKAIVSAVSGGGGGGGGGGASSPAATEAELWDAAMEKAIEYGDITRQEYIDYLNMRMAGEEKYSDAYFRYFKVRQGLENEIAREEADRQREQERAEKEAADEAKRRADELKKAADDASRASEQLTINVYTNSLDPMAVARAIEQAKRMGGRGFLQ